ncbi:MAG: HU family DNA-binding protein [Chlorobi bacterium]|nr:HU family DNA-binding protein [Chlorobiota bacterium]MCI0715894.1 HU family DNA-binding protein [Chlorobiota bacterium]
MNTVDLINKLAVNHDITTGRAEMIISILVERLTEKLKKDGTAKVENFGEFMVQQKENQSDSYMKFGEIFPSSRNQIMFIPDKKFLENINKDSG